MPGIINITPAAVRLIDANGCVAAAGTSAGDPGPLRAVFGVVLHGPGVAPPPNPWDSQVPLGLARQGNVNLATGAWNVSCPGAQGDCASDTLVVWGFFNGQSDPSPDTDTFQGDSTGSGCGSGAPESYPYLAARFQQERPSHVPAAVEALPRRYRLALDPEALTVVTPLGSLLLGGLLKPGSVLLAYDKHNASWEEPLWRGNDPASSSIAWVLQLRAFEGRPTAHAVLQRLTDSRVLPPLVWRTNHWSFFGRNVLEAQPLDGLPLPRLLIEAT